MWETGALKVHSRATDVELHGACGHDDLAVLPSHGPGHVQDLTQPGAPPPAASALLPPGLLPLPVTASHDGGRRHLTRHQRWRQLTRYLPSCVFVSVVLNWSMTCTRLGLSSDRAL